MEPRPRHPGARRQSPAFRNLQEVGCEDGAATRGDDKKKKEKDEATGPGQGRPDNPGKGHAKDRSKDKGSDGDDTATGRRRDGGLTASGRRRQRHAEAQQHSTRGAMASQHSLERTSATPMDATTTNPPAHAAGVRCSPATSTASAAANTGSIVITTAAVTADNAPWAQACTARPRQVATRAT